MTTKLGMHAHSVHLSEVTMRNTTMLDGSNVHTLAADGSGPLQVIYRQRLFCRAESLNPRAYRDRNWPAMDCRVVQHYFNALAEKSRPCQSWLVWTQMRLVALNWTDDVTFDVVTMTGDTISITCPEMRLISEVHQLIKTQLGHLKDKDISLCKDVVLMEPDAIGHHDSELGGDWKLASFPWHRK